MPMPPVFFGLALRRLPSLKRSSCCRLPGGERCSEVGADPSSLFPERQGHGEEQQTCQLDMSQPASASMKVECGITEAWIFCMLLLYREACR